MDEQSSGEQIRLNKFLAERLGISRRQADDLIAAGLISWRRTKTPDVTLSVANSGAQDALRETNDSSKNTFSGARGSSEDAWQTAKLGDRIDKSYEVRYNRGRLEQSGQGFGGSNKHNTAKSHQKLPDFCKNLPKTPDGRFLIPSQAAYLYYGLNKPVGYVCSRRAQGDAPTIYEILPAELSSLKTVGRLDKDSSGLILLTNDGDFAFQMTHPKFIKTKVYLVELDRNLAPLHQQEIADYGVEIGDGVSRLGLVKLSEAEFKEKMGKNLPEKVDAGEETWKKTRQEVQNRGSREVRSSDGQEVRKFFQVAMSEGRNRQIRRTFAALGYEVVRLHRVQFGKYCLGELAPGEYMPVPKV